MASTVTVYVDPDAAGGGTGVDWTNAYTDLQTAENAKDGDITAATGSDEIYVFECRSSGNTAETDKITVLGWTTAAGNYVEFKATSTDKAIITGYSATIWRVEETDDWCFDIAENFVRITDMQLKSTYSADDLKGCINIGGVDAANDIRISGCRITNAGAGSYYGIKLNDADGIMKVWNTIVCDVTLQGIFVQNCATVNVYNCITYNCGTDAMKKQGGTTMNAYNCVSFANTDDFDSLDVVDYCATDDGDGTNDVAGNEADGTWSTDFVGAGTGDFTMLTGSPLKDAGVNDPGSGLYSTGMDGVAYVTDAWCLGVYEFVEAAGGVAPTGALSGPLGGPLAGAF